MTNPPGATRTGREGRAPRRPGLIRRAAAVYAQIARVYRSWWAEILLLALIVFVPLGLVDAAFADGVATLDPDHDLELLAMLSAAGLVAATGLLGEVFFAGTIGLSLAHAREGRPPPLGYIARRISYGRLIAVDLLYVLATVAGVLLLLLPGIAVFVLLALAGPAVELEERGVRSAFARSFRLVRSDFWLVFWVLMPIQIVGGAIGEGIEALAHGALGHGFLASGLAEAISNVALSPLFALAAVLLTTRLIALAEDDPPPRFDHLRGGRAASGS